mmetsp:Transcript_10598/g.23677  ORF Transcript_10598/g.23677 Transcript_10598/m.23677 type:complete len:229 (-) Transcript_10598:81-767(-)
MAKSSLPHLLLALAVLPHAAAFSLASLPGCISQRALRGPGGSLALRASTSKSGVAIGRREVLAGAAGGFLALGGLGAGAERASAEDGGVVEAKRTGISDEELRAAVAKDVTEKQFMVTGSLTRGLYDESCTFQDDIDTYTLDKWLKGTALLFKNDYSKMELDGPITVTSKEVSFRWTEQLMFNIPVLLPKVPLTGTLVLTRGADGLFTSYREKWDLPVWKVLLSAKLF